MGLSKLIQDAIKTISEQAVSVAPYDKTRGGVIKGVGDIPNTYNVQVDGVVYTNVKTTGGIIPNINDTVTVIFPTNNSSQMVINSVSTQSWIKGASEFIYPVGIYYWTSDENFDPNVAFSGTWEKIDAGVTLVSAGTGYTVTTGTAKDGGEATHKLTGEESGQKGITISSSGGHTHTVTSYYREVANYGSGSAARPFTQSGSSSTTNWSSIGSDTGKHTHTISASNATSAHNNMPPYKCAYCWHRIL